MLKVLRQYGTVRTFEGSVRGTKAVFFVCLKDLMDMGFIDPDTMKFAERILAEPDPIIRAQRISKYFNSKANRKVMEELRLKIIGRIHLRWWILPAEILIVFTPYLSDVASNPELRAKMEDDLLEGILYYHNTMGVRLFGFGGATSTPPTCTNLFAKTRGLDILLLHGGYGTGVSNTLVFEKIPEMWGRKLEDLTLTYVGYGCVARPAIRMLAPQCKRTIVVVRNKKKLDNALSRLPDSVSRRIESRETKDINEAIFEGDIIGLAANSNDPNELAINPAAFKGKGRVVVDNGVPANLTSAIAHLPSIVPIRGGVIRLPGRSYADGLPDGSPLMRWKLRPTDTLFQQLGMVSRNEANACTCELAILAMLIQQQSVDQFCRVHGLDKKSLVEVSHDMAWINFIRKAWSDKGFNLSQLRSPTGVITQADFDRIKAFDQQSSRRTRPALRPAYE
jgi:predicted amino acid dehydrogenase